MCKKFDPVFVPCSHLYEKAEQLCVYVVVIVTFEIIIILPTVRKCGHGLCTTLTMHFCSIPGEHAWFAYICNTHYIRQNHNPHASMQGIKSIVPPGRLHVERRIARSGTVIIVWSSYHGRFKVRQLHCKPLFMITGWSGETHNHTDQVVVPCILRLCCTKLLYIQCVEVFSLLLSDVVLITLPPTHSLAAFAEGSFPPLPSMAVERSIGKGGNGTIS